MKQTAVDEIIDMCYTIIKNSTDSKVIQTAKLIIFRCENEFKEIEKQQIIDAFWNGDNTDCTSEQNSKEFAEQYYNETFKNKQDLEKEMFELEQELDIPSHLRWHNSKPKQETLEEAAEKYDSQYVNRLRPAFIAGAKWQQEQDKYSEEDLKQFAFECVGNFLSNRENELEIELVNVISDRNNKLFEKFKNK